MIQNTSKVYVKVDSKGGIIRCEGGYTTPTDLTGWVLVDEGVGDKFNLCQTHYFDGDIKTTSGIPRYKLVDNSVVQRSDAELAEIEAAKPPISPTPIEELQAENKLLKAQIQAQTERNDFMEDCIAEMAAQVYV